MRVIPEVNEIVELEESILIMNQIAKLENRIKMGGDFFFSGTRSWKFRSLFFPFKTMEESTKLEDIWEDYGFIWIYLYNHGF